MKARSWLMKCNGWKYLVASRRSGALYMSASRNISNMLPIVTFLIRVFSQSTFSPVTWNMVWQVWECVPQIYFARPWLNLNIIRVNQVLIAPHNSQQLWTLLLHSCPTAPEYSNLCISVLPLPIDGPAQWPRCTGTWGALSSCWSWTPWAPPLPSSSPPCRSATLPCNTVVDKITARQKSRFRNKSDAMPKMNRSFLELT